MGQQTQNAYDLTSSVAMKRLDELNGNFPALAKEQFDSEEAYRNALIKQYTEMRQSEYQYTCLTEGMRAYDVSLTICQKTNDDKYMNKATWDGCKSVMERYPQIQQEVSDSCYTRIPNDVTDTLSRSNGSYSCCAVSSKALESQISAKMGYDDEDNNFVQCYNTNQNAYHHRAANGFVNDPACKDYVAKGNLWKMIESGKAGQGATIAMPSKTTSGYHAKTIVAVNYDDNGKLKSYVLQGNNSNSFEVITSDSPKYSNIYVGDMNRWMTNKFQQEAQNMQTMTTEQLQEAVLNEKQKVAESISQLEIREKSLFENHPNDRQVTKYADYYIKNANIPDATKCVMKIDQTNAQVQSEQLEQKLKNQQTQPKQKDTTNNNESEQSDRSTHQSLNIIATQRQYSR